MKLNEPNLLIEAAKSGNFAAFCIFSLLEGVNLEKISDFEDFYEEIRKKLPNCKETEDSSWFSLQEFFDFYENSENLLLEVASTQSRMKMRRAAKRTVRIRARKRAIREKLRKNKTQLAKRAYNQVKTEMRNRLSGGKPWSSLSFSTRNRIDSMISKRKPILKRLVRQRVQKMPAQESQRLRKLSMREEYIQNEINLQETSNEQRERELGRERKRRFDRRNKEDPFRLVNRSYLVTGKKGKKSIVDRDSLTKNHKDVTKLSLGEQYLMTIINEAKETTVEGACNEKDITTQRSKELGCPDKKNTEKKSKEKKENTTSGATEGKSMTPPEQNQPNSYVELQPVQDSGRFGSSIADEGTAAMQSIRFSFGEDGFEKFKNDVIIASQVQATPIPEGKSIDPKYQEIYKNVIKTLNEHGLSEPSIQTLMRSPESVMAKIQTTQNGIDNQHKEPMMIFSVGTATPLTRDGESRGVSISDVVTISRNKLSKVYSEQKGTKKDPTLGELYEFGKQLIRDSVEGPTTQDSNIVLSRISSNYSIKYGKDQKMIDKMFGGERAVLLIDTTVNKIIEKIPNHPNILKFSDLQKRIADHIEKYMGSGKKKASTITRGGNEESSSSLKELQKAIQKEFDDLMDDVDFKTQLIYEHLMGESYFDETSVGSPTGGLMSIDSNGEVSFNEITEDYARQIAQKTTLRARFKSSSTNAVEDKANKRRFLDFKTEKIKSAQSKDSAFDKKQFDKTLKAALKSNENFLTEMGVRLDAEITDNDIGIFRKDPRWKNLSELQRELIEGKIRSFLRSSWLVLRAEKNNQQKKNATVNLPTNESFKFNPLLRLLLEQNKTTNNLYSFTPEEEAIVDELNDEYMEDFKPTEIYNTLDSIMQFSGLEFEDIYYEPPIDFSDFANKPKTSSINSVYVNGTLHMIPVDENPENMAENTRVTFASRFLNENKKRNYKSEYENYHSQSEQIKNRSKRNMARRWAERKGLVKKGDGKDIDHKNGNPKDNSPSNLRVRSRSANRADND